MVESSFDLYLLLRVDNVIVCVLVVQLGPTLWDPWTEPTRLFRPWILQARILEWVAMPFSRGSSWLRDWTWVSWIAGRACIWASREAQQNVISFCIKFPSASVSAFRLIRMQVAVITLRPRCHWPVAILSLLFKLGNQAAGIEHFLKRKTESSVFQWFPS